MGVGRPREASTSKLRAALGCLQLPPRRAYRVGAQATARWLLLDSDCTAPLVAQAAGTSMNKLRPPNNLRSPHDFAQRGVVANQRL